MPSDREQLISMGFPPIRVDKALKATGKAGIQPAMGTHTRSELGLTRKYIRLASGAQQRSRH